MTSVLGHTDQPSLDRAHAKHTSSLAPALLPATSMADRLRMFRWTLRRWSVRHIIYRLRLPARRRRWGREREELCRPFTKPEHARLTQGPALVFGEFSGTHGLGRAAAYDVEMLRAHHNEIVQIDIGSYLAGQKPGPLELNGTFENIYFLCQPDTYGTICTLLRVQDISGAYRIGRWAWETPLFPTNWRFAEALVHEVWAPSEFCAKTFRSAVNVPVKVVPHAVTAPRADTGIDMRARLGIDPQAFMGLAIMDIRSCPERKNPWAHVRAWKAAFPEDVSAVLVMKLRVGKRTRVVIEELSELIGDAGNIRLVTEDFTDAEIAALHHAADLYMSLHRSEGFGLNILEALMIGKPVVATHWSAN
ncbi:MAG: glycosyl transferase group 1, partial [Hyphomicrobiales bacterium]|nr:glycosyl transferase group 1 [Hyphomicrobiales bacterium]